MAGAKMMLKRMLKHRWFKRGGIALAVIYTLKAIVYLTIILAVYMGW